MDIIRPCFNDAPKTAKGPGPCTNRYWRQEGLQINRFYCETGDSKDIMKRQVVGQVVSMSTFDSISKHTIQQGKRLHPIPHTPNPTQKTRLKDNISSPKTKLIRKETPVSSMYMAPTQLSYPSSLQDPLRETCHDEPCLHSNRFQYRSHGLEGWRL